MAIEPAVEQLGPLEEAAAGAPRPARRKSEWLYFALRNRKFMIGFLVVGFAAVVAVVGPHLVDADPFEFGYGTGLPPSSEHLLGTTAPGQDVLAQLVYGLRASFVVGILSAVVAFLIATAVGFVAGYRGGVIDEVLSMLTNVVLVIPTLAVLIIVAAYLSVRGLVSEALLIGITSWPWAARAIRAQTFSLASRDFVSLARLSGARGRHVIVREIAPTANGFEQAQESRPPRGNGQRAGARCREHQPATAAAEAARELLRKRAAPRHPHHVDRTAIAGLNQTERQALVSDFIAHDVASYPFVDPNKLTVNAQDSAADGSQFIVSVSYDAHNLPIWSLFPKLPLPGTTILRQSTIRVGGI